MEQSHYEGGFMSIEWGWRKHGWFDHVEDDAISNRRLSKGELKRHSNPELT